VEASIGRVVWDRERKKNLPPSGGQLPNLVASLRRTNQSSPIVFGLLAAPSGEPSDVNREIRCHRVGTTAFVVGRVQAAGTQAIGAWSVGDGGCHCVVVSIAAADEEAPGRAQALLGRIRDRLALGVVGDLGVVVGELATGDASVWVGHVEPGGAHARWGFGGMDGDTPIVARGDAADIGHGLFLDLHGVTPQPVTPSDVFDSALGAVTARVAAAKAPLLLVVLGQQQHAADSASVKSRIAANIDGIEVSELAFSSLAFALGVPDKVRRSVLIALDDLLSNVINYAYEDAEGEFFEVHIFAASVGLRIAVRDTGPAFDPFALAEPDTTLDLDDRRMGGLGIHLVRHLMDEVSYERDGDANVVWLFKGLAED